jgi:hypothetical protein
MLLPAWPWLDALLNWLAYGVWDLSAWQLLLITLGMTHIVARLRCYADINDAVYHPWVYAEAADEIERLRAALEKLIAACDAGRPFERGSGGMTIDAQLARTVINGVRASAVEDARAALAGEKKNDAAP